MRRLVILIQEVKPPIPVRSFDYCAFVEGQEESESGWASYPAGAVRDLVEKIDDRYVQDLPA